MAVQHRVPFVLVMLNNTYMGLIRQSEKYGYDENYAVDLSTSDARQGRHRPRRR